MMLPLADISFSMHPAFSGGILAVLLLAALGLVAYLYRLQRRIASGRVIAVLTLLRAALVVLVLVVLLQPALRWTRTTSSAGTLWLMLDDSQSMTMTDPQSTPVERLRWADALGLLPEGLRTARPDYHWAQLLCLRQELLDLRPAVSALSTGSSAGDPSQVRKFAAALLAWRERLNQSVRAGTQDPALAATPAIGDALAQAARLVDQGRNAASGRANLRDAAAAVGWSYIQNNLDAALRDLQAAAERSDADFLRTHRTDSAVQSALADVARKSRAELTREILTSRAKRTTQNLADIIPQYQTRLVAIGNAAHAVENATDLTSAITSALGPTTESTNLAAGFALIDQQVGSAEPASVIVLSDGRQTVKDDPVETARLLASRGVKVYTLLIGSRQVSPDAAVDQVDAPDWIYKDDTLRVGARIRLDGLAGRRTRVDFLRAGTVLDTQYLTARSNEETQTLIFTDKPPEAPGYEYQVRVEEVPGEVNHENNRQLLHVAIKKDKLSVLIVEDQPRWEFRYLSKYLGRDPRVKLQTVLLRALHVEGVTGPAPVQASPGNPREEAQLLPETLDQWQAFDLVVLGDIPPDTLSAVQQQHLAAAVRDRGATLIVLAGPQHMPAEYAGTPLADLLPVTLGSAWPAEVRQTHQQTGFRPAVAPAAGDSTAAVLSRFGVDDDTNTLLWSKVPRWFWHSDQTQAKPNANVIWYIAEPEEAAGAGNDVGSLAALRRRALLSTTTLGLGRVLYLASDQTWRLRDLGGENVQDRFWGQVVRWAVGNDLPAGGRLVRFGANRPRYQQGDPLDPVVVTARVLREDLTPYSGLSFRAVARLLPVRVAAGETPRQVGSATLVESPDAPGYYRAALGGLPAGDIELSLQGNPVESLLNDDPAVTQKTVLVKVSPQLDAEQRDMNTDPRMMAALAQLGGGLALDGPYADVLAEHLPQIRRTLTHVEQMGFYGDPKDRYTYLFHWGFMALFVLLLTAEWVVRKFAGMV